MTERNQDEIRIVVVNAFSGDQLWEDTIESDSVQVFTNNEMQLILVRVAGEDPGLTAIDLLSGKTLWSRKVTAGNLIIEFGDEAILLVSKSVAMLDPRSGQEGWRTNSISVSGRPISVVTLDDGYVVTWDDGKICFVSQSGHLRWQTSVADRPELSTTAAELAIVTVAPQTGRDGWLQALSLKDGRPIWRYDLTDRMFSAITLDGERLVFSTETTIEAVAVPSGRQLFKKLLARRSGNRLPDHIVMFPDHMIVASEIILSAHERNSGDEIWSLDLMGTDHLTARASRSKLGSMVVGSGGNAVADNISSYSTSITTMQAQSDFYTKQARQNYQDTYRRTQPNMLSGSAAERADASFERSLAASHMENVNTINRSFDTMMMSVQGAFNALAAAQAVEQNAKYGAAAAERDRAIRRLTMAHKIHERAIQNMYFVRPFESKTGNGLVIVDMWDGRWTEIPVSPSEAFLDDRIYMNLNLGLIGADSTILVTKGTGLDPERWTKDDRFEASGIQKTMFSWALDDRYRTVLIRRSMLGYDLSKAVFHDLEAYKTESLTKKTSRIIN
jgi:outer membrane protein assembly factor BamB